MTMEYLSYLHQYFIVNFNTLLPMVSCIDRGFMDLFLRYLIEEYSVFLDEFLREDKEEEEETGNKQAN